MFALLFPSLFFPALLAAADAPLVDVFHVHHVIPRHDWSYWAIEDLTSVEESAQVKVDFTVDSGPPVRVEIMHLDGVARLKKGRYAGAVLASTPEVKGSLQTRLPDPGDYAIVIDNRDNDSSPATVRLAISLDYGSGGASGVRRLSASRQLTVILVSFAVFFGIVGFSARKLWQSAVIPRGPR